MKRITVLLAATVLLCSLVMAQVPHVISHQGYVADATGTGVTATLPMSFRLFPDPTGGLPLFTQLFPSVGVTKGVFTVNLQVGSLEFIGPLYLETTIDGEVLSPRTALTSAPFSLAPWTSDGPNIHYNAGNVGIGTTTPTAKLEIGGTPLVDGIKFPDGTLQTTAATGGSGGGWTHDGSTVRLTTSTDNVGIGTTSPGEKLEVAGNIFATSNSGSSLVRSRLFSNSSSESPWLDVLRSRGTLSSSSAILNGDILGTLSFSGRFGSGVNDINSSALIRAVAREDWGTGGPGQGAALDFYTVNNQYGTPISHMRIDQNGNVGIGQDNTNPGTPLQVNTYSSGGQPVSGGGTALQLRTIRGAGYDINQQFTDGTNSSWVGMASGQYLYFYAPRTYSPAQWETELVMTPGKVRIGNGGQVPINTLDVQGSMAIGASYATNQIAPSSGLLVQGNVGIGTPTPTAKLEIGGTSGIDGIKFPDGTLQTTAGGGWTRDGTNVSLITSTDNVGIGTMSPSDRLQIARDDAVTSFTGTVATVGILNTNTTANNWSVLSFQGNTTGGAAERAARIGAQITSHNASTVTGDLAFSTVNAGSESEQMRITSTGNVGIGTTSPEHKLHVDGSIVGTKVFAISETTNPSVRTKLFSSTLNTSNDVATVETFRARGTKAAPAGVESGDNLGEFQWGAQWGTGLNDVALGSSIRGIATENWSGSAQGSAIEFSTTANGTAPFPSPPTRMKIDQNGNVGIGTTSPSEKLEVSGSIKASTSLKVGSATIFSGTGSPEGVVTGNKGDLFLRTDGGAGTTMYVKESGTGNTGWVGK